MKVNKKFAFAAVLAAFVAIEVQSQAVRYQGLAAGAGIKNQYSVGDWADYSPANLGITAFAEYTLPEFLPKSMDMGASLHIDYDHSFTKGTLERYEGVTASAGLWLRIPFAIKNQSFAFQPEVSYGVNFAMAKGKDGTDTNGLYLSQAICVAPALRYVAPVEALKNLEFEFSPLWTIMPQKGGGLIQTIGFRFGALWHFGKIFKKNGGDK